MATKKPTKKTAKETQSGLLKQMKSKGLKMPHGYTVTVRKKK